MRAIIVKLEVLTRFTFAGEMILWMLVMARRRTCTNRDQYRKDAAAPIKRKKRKRVPSFRTLRACPSRPLMTERARWVNFLNGQTDDFWHYVRVAGSRCGAGGGGRRDGWDRGWLGWIKDGNRLVAGYHRHPQWCPSNLFPRPQALSLSCEVRRPVVLDYDVK